MRTILRFRYEITIREATLKWALLEQLREPPKAFRDVVLRHFWLRKRAIIAQVCHICIALEHREN